MVEAQIARRGVRDERVLAAMREVPRERFVIEAMRGYAFEDSALPIEAGQTISQPYIVALMLEAAAIEPSDRVLEIGAGSGYAAAVAGRLAREVHAIERLDELATLARERMAALGYDNVRIYAGDGTHGLPDAAPFDAILVAAGAPSVPATLRDQLVIGGRLVLPVGGSGVQRLLRIVRRGEDAFDEEDLGGVRFVPLIGAHGWSEPG
ncbi:MAG: protein-L-isoaspartate(D-aspartate) O-methyltransferase [Sphingomonadaceae bacterium]|nr:protein-L-isoaspartate(D-aspartate) O-methyltransferase [Sphingomonadaceae bacterium]